MTSLPTIQMQGAMVRMEAVTVAITAVKDTNNRLLQPGVVLVGVAHLGSWAWPRRSTWSTPSCTWRLLRQ